MIRSKPYEYNPKTGEWDSPQESGGGRIGKVPQEVISRIADLKRATDLGLITPLAEIEFKTGQAADRSRELENKRINEYLKQFYDTTPEFEKEVV